MDTHSVLSFINAGFTAETSRTINSIITSFTSIFTALIALTNLFAVLYIFRKNKKDEKEEKQKKKFSFWYQDIIIKTYMPKIELFYKDIDNLTKKIIKNSNQKQTLLLEVSERFTDFDLEFVELVKIMSDDFAVFLSGHLEKLEDYIHTALEDDDDELKFSHTMIVDSKREMIIALFNYDRQNYKFVS